MSIASNGSILPSGPLARLNARNHRGPPRPPHPIPVCITGYCNPSVSNRFAYVSFRCGAGCGVTPRCRASAAVAFWPRG